LGCLSTVHIHATCSNEGLVSFKGDSDGLLTKGLVALLVRYVTLRYVTLVHYRCFMQWKARFVLNGPTKLTWNVFLFVWFLIVWS
jgi:Fe-S metabolism associated domain